MISGQGIKVVNFDSLFHHLIRLAHSTKSMRAVVGDILAGEPDWRLPKLNALVRTPVFTKDGSLATERGYHVESGIYLLDDGLGPFAPVNPNPTSEEVDKARQTLREPFSDFPFVDGASWANAVALILLPLAREMIDGPCPLHIIDAPKARTGKTLFAQALGLIHSLDGMKIHPPVSKEEELNKSLTAILKDRPQYVLFDNIQHRFNSESLASVITAYPSWSSRQLGPRWRPSSR